MDEAWQARVHGMQRIGQAQQLSMQTLKQRYRVDKDLSRLDIISQEAKLQFLVSIQITGIKIVPIKKIQTFMFLVIMS